MNNIKLKPCPFCGGEAVQRESLFGFFAIECIQCGALVSFFGKERRDLCAKAWNWRGEK